MSRSTQIIRWFAMVVLASAVTTPSALAQGRGIVSGKVVDEADNPIEGVAVKAERVGFSNVLETTTGSDGSFQMIGFSSAQWTFSVSAEGFGPQSDTIQVRQTANRPLNIVLRRIRESVPGVGGEASEELDPEISREIAAANAEYNAQNWDAAISGYNAVLEKEPALSRLLLYVGNAHRAKGENEESLAAYERLQAADPTHETVEAEIARTKLSMGDYDAASAGLEAAASGLDATREDLFNLGELEFAKGNLDAATAWYEKAAMADPNWGFPPFQLALVALNRGDVETAKQLFEKVIAVDPSSEQAVQAKATLDSLP